MTIFPRSVCFDGIKLLEEDLGIFGIKPELPKPSALGEPSEPDRAHFRNSRHVPSKIPNPILETNVTRDPDHIGIRGPSAASYLKSIYAEENQRCYFLCGFSWVDENNEKRRFTETEQHFLIEKGAEFARVRKFSNCFASGERLTGKVNYEPWE